MALINDLEQIKEILLKNDLTLSVAESCTGGLVSSYLTDISGASGFIEQNFVTYSNEAKNRFLNVDKKTLETLGAVSPEVAHQMAFGLLNYAKTSIATTGILGPTGGSKEKPIGLCYMGFGYKKPNGETEIKVIKFNSKILPEKNNSKRTEIKADIAKAAISNYLKFLLENI